MVITTVKCMGKKDITTRNIPAVTNYLKKMVTNGKKRQIQVNLK